MKKKNSKSSKKPQAGKKRKSHGSDSDSESSNSDSLDNGSDKSHKYMTVKDANAEIRLLNKCLVHISDHTICTKDESGRCVTWKDDNISTWATLYVCGL